MSDFSDTLNAVIIGNWISQPNRGDLIDNAARQRAKNIEDNSGLKAQDIAQYRAEHGGTGLAKGLGFIAAGLALGAIAMPAFGIGIAALAVGAIAGAVAASISMGAQGRKVHQGYDGYLDTIAAQGREAKARTIVVEHAQDNGRDRSRTFTEQLAQQSNGTQSAGAVR